MYIDDETAAMPEGWMEAPGPYRSERSGDFRFPRSIPRIFFRAYHIMQWRSESVYCGRCGTPNGDATDELARLCPKCGRREYARISPAVIVLVSRDDGCALLAHNVKFKEGLYSLVAGFVEAGECLEETVAREIREESRVWKSKTSATERHKPGRFRIPSCWRSPPAGLRENLGRI